VTAAAAFALAEKHGVEIALDNRGDLVLRSRGSIPPDVLASLRQAKEDMLAALRRLDRTGALTGDDLLDALRRKGFVIRRYGDNAVVDDETEAGRAPPMPLLREVIENHHAYFAALLAWSAPDQALRGDGALVTGLSE
jgi:hypothetical protein